MMKISFFSYYLQIFCMLEVVFFGYFSETASIVASFFLGDANLDFTEKKIKF